MKLTLKARKHRKIIVATITVLLLVAAGAVAYYLVRPENTPPVVQQKPPAKLDANGALEQSDEELRLVGVLKSYVGKYISYDDASGLLSLTRTSDDKKVQLAVDDDTTVHKGVSNEKVTLSDLRLGQDIAVAYDSEKKVIYDIWYNDDKN